MVADGKAPGDSYDPAFFPQLFQVEDRHFWFRARNRVVAMVTKRLTADLPKGYRVLEIGCGTGNTLRVLEETCDQGTVIGVDLYAEGLRYARQRSSAWLVQADMHALPFGEPFHLIALFDVLEHMHNDGRVLQYLYGVLAPGGMLVITVPAHHRLWSYFDEASRHCRRYQRAELSQKLQDVGYRVEQMTYYMASILPLVWIGRKLAALMNRQQVSRGSGVGEPAFNELHVRPVINEILARLLVVEARVLARRGKLPVGASLLVVARRETQGGEGVCGADTGQGRATVLVQY